MLPALLLTPLLAFSQNAKLLEVERIAPPIFTPAKETKAPSFTEQQAVKKEATYWVGRRAKDKTWKPGKFEFIGTFRGRPADKLEREDYAVYRLRFITSPNVGNQVQADMLFYARGKELLWPSDQWPRDDAPPGQMQAAIRLPSGNR